MHTTLRSEVLQQVVSLVEACRPLVDRVKHKDRDLAAQIRRALSSVGLNIAEGFGTAAGNARLRFLAARGSLYEAQAGLRIAVAWGYLSAPQVSVPLQQIDRLAARIYGLSRN